MSEHGRDLDDLLERQWPRPRDQLAQRARVLDAHPVEFMRGAEQGPLGVHEAEGANHRQLRSPVQRRTHRLQLPTHVPRALGAVATTDEKSTVGAAEQAGDVAHPDLTRVALGVDDVHAAGRNDDVVDVPAHRGYAAIVEGNDVVAIDAPQHGGELALPDRPALPGARGRGVARQSQDQAADTAPALPDPGFTPLVAPPELAHRRTARDARVDVCSTDGGWRDVRRCHVLRRPAGEAGHERLSGTPPRLRTGRDVLPALPTGAGTGKAD